MVCSVVNIPLADQHRIRGSSTRPAIKSSNPASCLQDLQIIMQQANVVTLAIAAECAAQLEVAAAAGSMLNNTSAAAAGPTHT